jgi:hypothetical protein
LLVERPRNHGSSKVLAPFMSVCTWSLDDSASQSLSVLTWKKRKWLWIWRVKSTR